MKTLRHFSSDPHSITSKESILITFCETALRDEVSQGFNLPIAPNTSTTQERYSSQQSLFLRLLC
ncbi:MAG: hypothetical protein Q4B28_00175 [bacterium]|nr:hypothetical protein [bacterium]